jgi:hypothetical protein
MLELSLCTFIGRMQCVAYFAVFFAGRMPAAGMNLRAGHTQVNPDYVGSAITGRIGLALKSDMTRDQSVVDPFQAAAYVPCRGLEHRRAAKMSESQCHWLSQAMNPIRTTGPVSAFAVTRYIRGYPHTIAGRLNLG